MRKKCSECGRIEDVTCDCGECKQSKHQCIMCECEQEKDVISGLIYVKQSNGIEIKVL